jgi:hypothetical protein
VGPPLVYLIRSKTNQARRRANRARFDESSSGSGSVNPVDLFVRVRDLSRDVGGIRNLKKLVDLLAE